MNGTFDNLFDNNSATGLIPYNWNGAWGLSSGYVQIDFDVVPPVNYITFNRHPNLGVRIEGYDGKTWHVLYDDHAAPTRLDCLRYDEYLPYSSYRVNGYGDFGYWYLYCLAFADTKNLVELSMEEIKQPLLHGFRTANRVGTVVDDLVHMNRKGIRQASILNSAVLMNRNMIRTGYISEVVETSIRSGIKFALKIPENTPIIRNRNKLACAIEPLKCSQRKGNRVGYTMHEFFPMRRDVCRKGFLAKNLVPVRKRKVVLKRSGYVFIL